MKPIKSFTIDHTKLTKGLYVSRVDKVSLFSYATTFDLRMKTPYKDRPIKPATAHTLEHCLAYYLRNTRKDILYVGPMGCMTGFYVVVSGKKGVFDILDSLYAAMGYILDTGKVAGATMKECGNYTFMDLEDAKREANAYRAVLEELEREEKE